MINRHGKAIKAALVVTMGGLIFGLDAALISGGIRSIAADFSLDDLQVGTVVGAPGLGVLGALLVTGPLCDRIGRKRTLLIIASLYLISAVMSVLAPSYGTLVFARLLGGMAFTSLSVASIYIGEIAPAHIRGKLVSILQLMIVIGLSAAFFINYGIYSLGQSEAAWAASLGFEAHSWRWMLGAEIVPALIWLIMLWSIPESPRWLAAQGRTAEAKGVVAGLASQEEGELISEDVMRDYGVGPDGSVVDGSESLGLAATIDALWSTPLRKAATIGLIVAIAQPITGMNAIMFYSPIVFEQLGSGTDTALLQAILVGLLSVVATLASLFVIDRIGRRPLFIGGLAVAAICLLVCWYGFSQASYTLSAETLASLSFENADALAGLAGKVFETDVAFKSALVDVLGFDAARAQEGALLNAAASINGNLIFVAVLGFLAAFQATIGPILWVLFSEIFPTRVRAVAVTGCAFVTSLISWLVQKFFPYQLAEWGAANVFLFYALCVIVSLGLISLVLPETKNKTIEEIEAGFHGIQPKS